MMTMMITGCMDDEQSANDPIAGPGLEKLGAMVRIRVTRFVTGSRHWIIGSLHIEQPCWTGRSPVSAPALYGYG